MWSSLSRSLTLDNRASRSWSGQGHRNRNLCRTGLQCPIFSQNVLVAAWLTPWSSSEILLVHSTSPSHRQTPGDNWKTFFFSHRPAWALKKGREKPVTHPPIRELTWAYISSSTSLWCVWCVITVPKTPDCYWRFPNRKAQNHFARPRNRTRALLHSSGSCNRYTKIVHRNEPHTYNLTNSPLVTPESRTSTRLFITA